MPILSPISRLEDEEMPSRQRGFRWLLAVILIMANFLSLEAIVDSQTLKQQLHSVGSSSSISSFPFHSSAYSLHNMRSKTGGRPPPHQRRFVSVAVDRAIANISSKMKDPELATLFTNCYPNTLDTTVYFSYPSPTMPDTFVITGDIIAMWLRDSTNQVLPYVRFVNEDELLNAMILGVIWRQTKSILLDPYANAFNKDLDASPWLSDNTYKLGFLNSQVPAMNLHLHERKYELDSLAAVITLAYHYYNTTKSIEPFLDEDHKDWFTAMDLIMDIIEDQQRGSDEGAPNYYFERQTTRPTDTLLWGTGGPAKRTGMSKSPFRPSDDASALAFPIAANAMAVSALKHLSEMLKAMNKTTSSQRASTLSQNIATGISKYGTMQHPIYGQIYAYEVDGFGNAYAMDDANVPSLLSLPYLGFTSKSNSLYKATRKFILSNANPYFSKGSAAEGIGSPHVGLGYIWPMSIIMRALTSDDDNEIMNCLEMIKTSSAGTGFLHESFWKDNPNSYTRPWFAWVNSLFGELILTLASERPSLIFGNG